MRAVAAAVVRGEHVPRRWVQRVTGEPTRAPLVMVGERAINPHRGECGSRGVEMTPRPFDSSCCSIIRPLLSNRLLAFRPRRPPLAPTPPPQYATLCTVRRFACRLGVGAGQHWWERERALRALRAPPPRRRRAVAAAHHRRALSRRTSTRGGRPARLVARPGQHWALDPSRAEHLRPRPPAAHRLRASPSPPCPKHSSAW